MTYFDACSIYQDFSVHIQYKDMFGKSSNNEAAIRFVHKYGRHKIYEAVKVLLADLDEKRKIYLDLIKIVNIVERMEEKA
jgi:hypothetical protein